MSWSGTYPKRVPGTREKGAAVYGARGGISISWIGDEEAKMKRSEIMERYRRLNAHRFARMLIRQMKSGVLKRGDCREHVLQAHPGLSIEAIRHLHVNDCQISPEIFDFMMGEEGAAG